MHRTDFTYTLPDELIAQHPAPHRDQSRLMRVPLDGPLSIGPFSEILQAFRGDEVLVVNETRVVPARLFGHKATGGAVEVLVVEPRPGGRLKAMVGGKRLHLGTKLVLPEAEAELLARYDDGTVELALSGVDDVFAWLDRVGELPLPPYIERAPAIEDRERYQTVFAREPGAVAAPTAGLHFTPELLAALTAKGVAIHKLTLHVGPGTFRPVKVEDIRTHVMHAERYTIPETTWAAVNSGRPVVAVGTTVVRALESHARRFGAGPASSGEESTDIFIYPGYSFAVVDGLLTNFHLPESTLLMLVCAFAGQARVLDAYAQAVSARLRFFSYGDAMLLCREGGRWT